MSMGRRARTALAGLGGWLVAALPAVAQCPMCKLAAENAGDPLAVQRTFSTAILILMVPVVGLTAGMAALLWKHRN